MQVYNKNRIMPNALSFKGNAVGDSKKETTNINGVSFQDILSEKLETTNLQFSKHASMRLNNRDISLSQEQLKRVEDGVDSAGKKGIKDSLVLVDNVALVVNVKNRVVITAMNQGNDSENIFTNIDGAVIV